MHHILILTNNFLSSVIIFFKNRTRNHVALEAYHTLNIYLLCNFYLTLSVVIYPFAISVLSLLNFRHQILWITFFALLNFRKSEIRQDKICCSNLRIPCTVYIEGLCIILEDILNFIKYLWSKLVITFITPAKSSEGNFEIYSYFPLFLSLLSTTILTF